MVKDRADPTDDSAVKNRAEQRADFYAFKLPEPVKREREDNAEGGKHAVKACFEAADGHIEVCGKIPYKDIVYFGRNVGAEKEAYANQAQEIADGKKDDAKENSVRRGERENDHVEIQHAAEKEGGDKRKKEGETEFP